MTELSTDYFALLDLDLLIRVLIQLGLFAGSAFFSGSETALFSLSRMDLRKLRRERNPHTETLHALLNQPRNLIIAILCGNTFINVAATANMTGILVALFGSDSAAWISTFVMVPLLLLLGEATPKTIAISDPIGVTTRIVARPMGMWVAFISPASRLVRQISDRITTSMVGEERARENILHIDEFRALVEEGVVSGELTATEQSLIYNLMQAGNDEAVEIMIPRNRMAMINGGLPIPELISQFIAYRHDRVPVFKHSRDNIIGFLHSEDIFQIVLDKVDIDTLALESLVHPPIMIPPTRKIDEMFDYFQNHNHRAACVLNEFGGVDGLLTMADILAYIFGKVQAEPEPLETAITHNEENQSYEVPGEMKLIEFNKLTHYGITDPRMTTIGGVVFRHLGRLPEVGDRVVVNNIELAVSAVENLIVSKVLAKHVSHSQSTPPHANIPPETSLENQPYSNSDNRKDEDKAC